jgi:hypothetical protein
MNQEGQIDGSISLDRFPFVDAIFMGVRHSFGPADSDRLEPLSLTQDDSD